MHFQIKYSTLHVHPDFNALSNLITGFACFYFSKAHARYALKVVSIVWNYKYYKALLNGPLQKAFKLILFIYMKKPSMRS